jgi:hypothetical protein
MNTFLEIIKSFWQSIWPEAIFLEVGDVIQNHFQQKFYFLPPPEVKSLGRTWAREGVWPRGTMREVGDTQGHLELSSKMFDQFLIQFFAQLQTYTVKWRKDQQAVEIGQLLNSLYQKKFQENASELTIEKARAFLINNFCQMRWSWGREWVTELEEKEVRIYLIRGKCQEFVNVFFQRQKEKKSKKE